MKSIQDSWQKIKLAGELGLGDWGMVVLVVLIAFACFGLGRLSALEETKSSIHITEADMKAIPMNEGGMLVASKSGSTYYFPWCGGAEALKPDDEVWFQSETSAQKAGYTAAKNCKGLSS
jgi:hypothetical protein